jgi:hypothetical protein
MADQNISQITQNQVGFAPEVAPYAQTLLGKAQAFADPNIPYQAYKGQRVADFTDLQNQAFQGAQGMQPSYQLTGASGLAGLAGQQALGTQYNPTNYQSQSFTGGDMAQRYMSPYVQGVVDIQQREAQRQADIAATQQAAQATKAGAVGGGRDAIMRAEAARNLAIQKGDIQTKGMQDAYTQAMNQFNQEQQQRQQAAQLGEQSRQYGAGLGLQGLQTAMTGANTLNAIGQNQFTQGMDINKLQNTYGLQQQNQQNTILGNQYQDWLNAQNQPYKQMGFMSDIIRGAPLSQMGSTIYSAPASPIAQMAGVGLAAKGLGMFADGGAVQDVAYRDKPAGLADLAIYKMG